MCSRSTDFILRKKKKRKKFYTVEFFTTSKHFFGKNHDKKRVIYGKIWGFVPTVWDNILLGVKTWPMNLAREPLFWLRRR